MNGIVKLALFIILSLPSFMAAANHQALWEGGAGVGLIDSPYYPGSSYRRNYYIPVPFMRLRHKIYRVDEDGARGKIFHSGRSSLDISLAGNVPVPKMSQGGRKDMPALDALGEIGPVYQYELWRAEDKRQFLELKFPLRAVFSVGDPLIANQGFRFTPYLYYLHKRYSGSSLWRTSISIGPMFGDRDYHAYYYQVDPSYATADRAAYSASSGYSGSRVTVTFSHNAPKSFIGLFVRYDNLAGAAFRDSPVMEQNNYFIAGIAAVWVFAQSEARAQHDH